MPEIKFMLCGAGDVDEVVAPFKRIVEDFYGRPMFYKHASHIHRFSNTWKENSALSVSEADIIVFVIYEKWGEITWEIEYREAIRLKKNALIFCHEKILRSYYEIAHDKDLKMRKKHRYLKIFQWIDILNLENKTPIPYNFDNFGGVFKQQTIDLFHDAILSLPTLSKHRRVEYNQEIQHVNLAVEKLDISVEFYHGRLKLPFLKRPPFEFGGVWFGLPNGQHIHLVETGIKRAEFRLPELGDVKTPPDPHFAIYIKTDKFREYTKRLSGCPTVDQPYPNIPGIMQFYVLDPDNYLIEITDIEEDKRFPEHIDVSEWEKYAYWWRDGDKKYPG